MRESTESTWILAAFALAVFASFVLPLEAEAQFPKPKPAASAPAVIAPPAPTPPAPPPVVQAPEPDYPPPPPQGWTQMDVLMWIWTALGSVFAGVFTKNSFWPKSTMPPAPVSLVDGLLKQLSNPAVKQQLDAALLQMLGDIIKQQRGGTP